MIGVRRVEAIPAQQLKRLLEVSVAVQQSWEQGRLYSDDQGSFYRFGEIVWELTYGGKHDR